ncbi:hypothetical protein Vadar_022292 [Vaccinium darrowii]|uniref:Uncharacterized protein n=1 Tax=Vaccinium darrowii TaxID=229202 RepID=A0ACB7YP55_9ERIC|nr:hypothetical protein Vadar_022292 [Vaccinium darrowii]
MAKSDSIEEITPRSDSSKAPPSSTSENNHQNAASSSENPNKNDQHHPSSEIIPNYLCLVNLAWKMYTDHMNGRIYVASKEFKRRQYLESDEHLNELHNAIEKLKSKIPKLKLDVPLTSNKDDHDIGAPSQMISTKLDLLDLAFAEVQEFMESAREEINQAGAKSKDKCSIPRQVVRTTTKMRRPRQVVANFKANSGSIEETTASSGSTKALPSTPCENKHATSSEKITNDLRSLNSAWKKYTDHMNAQINMASEKFKKIRNLGSIEKHFDKLQKAIENLQSQVKEWQIRLPSKEDDHDGGDLFQMIESDLLLLDSDFAVVQELTKADFDKLQKVIENLKSQIEELQIRLTSKEDDHDGGALFQMIESDLNHLASAFAEVPKFKEIEKAIENLKSKVKELQIPLTSKEDDPDGGNRFQMIERDLNHLASAFAEVPKFKETDFDKLQKAIEKLKSKDKELQIPLTSNEDDYDDGDLFQEIQRDLDLLRSAWEEAQKFMESTKWEIDQAYAKCNKLQKANSEEQQKSESYKLRKGIAKLRVRIHSYCEIRSTTDSNRHHYEWPNINGVKDGMMHFFFKEPKRGDGTMDFSKLPEPVLYCLLCFFKFPPDAFIRRTTMIYLWIGQGYILQHLQEKNALVEKEELLGQGYIVQHLQEKNPLVEKEELLGQGYILQHLQEKYPSVKKEELRSLEEDAGQKIFDELITNGFIERRSLEPNSYRLSHSARSSLKEKAEVNGFTSNGPLDLHPESVRGKPIGHSCLINVGEAIINCKPEIFENMAHIRSLYLGRWRTSATHHIELPDTKFFHGMSKLNNLTFLSLRGISLITELPTFISELISLKILDIRACHNLEAIPDEIGSLQSLTHLDMSECYFLEHMPRSLAQLSKLEVLKGFFIGGSENNKQSCTLSDLSKLSKLRKLNIYTNVEKFPATLDINALRAFQRLLKLTISWGGFSSPEETGVTTASVSEEEGEETLHPRLQKLDLQGFPMKSLPRWLRPSDLKELRKLYIRGGNLSDLGQLRENQGEHWNVEILRLKYLDALDINWSKLMQLFPKLIYLLQKQCAKLNFKGDERSGWSEWKGEESSAWMHKKAIETRLWLQQQFFRSDVNSINLSSLLGYQQKIAQHNSNASRRSENSFS